MAPRSASEFECNRCGDCCRTHRVPVTHVDVERLVSGGSQSADLQGFLGWLAPDEVDMADEPESFVELGVGRRVLVLAQKRTGDDGQQRADCIFWRQDMGCSVYPQRPAACRTYPFEPEHHRDDERFHLRVHPDAVCDPSTGIDVFRGDSIGDAADDDPTRHAIASYEARQRELSDYVTRVASWNRRQRRRRLAGKRPEPDDAFLRSLLE